MIGLVDSRAPEYGSMAILCEYCNEILGSKVGNPKTISS
jgi:hypothetical protein